MTTASQKVGNYGFLTVSAPGNGTSPTTYSFRSTNGTVNGSINNATITDLGSYTQAIFSGDRTQTNDNWRKILVSIIAKRSDFTRRVHRSEKELSCQESYACFE